MIDLKALRNVGNLHEFAVLFGFDWDDPDWNWTWHDVAVKMADDIETWNASKEPITLMSPITVVSPGEPQTYVPLRTCKPIWDEDGLACDKCGYWWPLKHYDNGKPRYCPNCGAKVAE